METKSERSLRTPRKFYGVGDEFTIGNARFRVVARPPIELPRDACSGCFFASRICPENIACSSFDRRDKVSVWFVNE